MAGNLMRLRGYHILGRQPGDASVWVPSGVDATGPALDRTPDAPPFLGVWLLILVDNTLHMCINYAALTWL